MTRNDFYRALDARIPLALREDWDNDGAMLMPNAEKQVKRILCTLDVTDDVIDFAEKISADLILSHHPLIFGGIKALNGGDPTSRRVLKLLGADIAVFSFHTRLDAMEGGINDALAEALGLCSVEPMGEGEAALGRVGEFSSPMSFEDFCTLVKKVTDAPFVNACVKTDAVCRVAVVGGAGKDFIPYAEAAGADTYLSGSLAYHAMVDGEINLVECGHYYSERHAAYLLEKLAKTVLPEAETKIYVPNSLRVY